MHLSMSRRALLASLALPLAAACDRLDARRHAVVQRLPDRPLTRIALGSCLDQRLPQPVWRTILAANPDLFIHLGDNVYADTLIPAEMAEAYRSLWGQADYQALRRNVPVMACWDDHDYGWSDAGAGYLMKEPSRALFCDFFGEPADSPRRRQPGGTYSARAFGPPGRRVRVIMLDGRWDRTPQPIAAWGDRARRDAAQMGYLDSHRADRGRLLGEAQWRWLDHELRKPAALRIIACGTRILAEETGYEAWASFPSERRRLFEVIRRTEARGVLLVSGDPHIAEVSRLAGPYVPYPLWELTASALNQPGDIAQRNERRVLGPWGEPNFGLIEIDWMPADPLIRFEVRGADGRRALRQVIPLGDLRTARA